MATNVNRSFQVWWLPCISDFCLSLVLATLMLSRVSLHPALGLEGSYTNHRWAVCVTRVGKMQTISLLLLLVQVLSSLPCGACPVGRVSALCTGAWSTNNNRQAGEEDLIHFIKCPTSSLKEHFKGNICWCFFLRTHLFYKHWTRAFYVLEV